MNGIPIDAVVSWGIDLLALLERLITAASTAGPITDPATKQKIDTLSARLDATAEAVANMPIQGV